MQHENGSIQWKVSSDAFPVWMTAYAAPAYAGQPLPVSPPPRSPHPTSPSSSGQGGESTQAGSGVIAGGGGNGALLFSRPQPGSKGQAPGGMRQLEDQHHDATKHRRNPGPPRRSPAPAITAASVHRAQRHNPASKHNPARKHYSAKKHDPAKNHDPAGHKGTGGVSLAGAGAGGGGQGSGREVKGLLIGAPADALEAGAPGLHGAGAGTNQTPWLAIAIATALLLSVFAGAQIELRRPRVIV